MNTELFIARKLFFEKSNQGFLSQKVIRIALAGIALGLAVMIVSVAVITGFKRDIRNKVIGFGSHIQIVNYDSNSSYETKAITDQQPFLEELKSIHGIKSVYPFATKPGMIKTDEYFQGIVLKGLTSENNWDFLNANLTEGRIPSFADSVRSREVLISAQTAKMLNLKTGDEVVFYFINEDEISPRILQLTISGIYRTSLEDFDRIFVFGDIRQIQRLNNWNSNEISGFEIILDQFGQIENAEQQVRELVIRYREENSALLRTSSILREYPQIFDWLSVLDMNVWVILVLLSMVAGFNMISGLLVLILERSRMIGELKAMGAQNKSVRKIFLYLALFLTGRGMIWGNLAGITIILIQKYLQPIKLDPAIYYTDVVPVIISPLFLILLNAGSFIVIAGMLIFPSYLVSTISPDKTIRFD